MAKSTRKPFVKHLGFYFVIFLVAASAWESQSYMQWLGHNQLAAQGGIAGVVLDQLSPIQVKQLDAYMDINRLLTTLGTTLLGAVFFLIFSGSKSTPWKQHQWAALLGALFISVSIFFGYVAYLFVISMLGDGSCDVTVSTPHWAQQAHFYTFLVGVVFFADFTYHNLVQEDGRDYSKAA